MGFRKTAKSGGKEINDYLYQTISGMSKQTLRPAKGRFQAGF